MSQNASAFSARNFAPSVSTTCGARRWYAVVPVKKTELLRVKLFHAHSLFSAAQKSDQLERAAAPQISPTSNDLQKAARTWREQEKRCYVA